MASEELHDVVDVEKIEPKAVDIKEKRRRGDILDGSEPQKKYIVTYTLPIKVSKKWQGFFQVPDPTSGVMHQVSFAFSADGGEVMATLDNEPAPELLVVLKKYAERANDKWKPYREKAAERKSEAESILKRLKEGK